MFKLTIETDNEAFDYRELEIERILIDVARRVALGATEGVIADYNGNLVGKFEITEAEHGEPVASICSCDMCQRYQGP